MSEFKPVITLYEARDGTWDWGVSVVTFGASGSWATMSLEGRKLSFKDALEAGLKECKNSKDCALKIYTRASTTSYNGNENAWYAVLEKERVDQKGERE